MAPVKVFIILFLFLSLAQSYSSTNSSGDGDHEVAGRKRRPPPPSPPPSPPPPTPRFDYYILEVIWPPTFCFDRSDCITLPREFIIHGLWPNDVIGCNQNDPLTSASIQKQLSQLQQHMPNLKKNEGDFFFWSRQWLKHGTCSGLSQTIYFQNMLDTYYKLGDIKANLDAAIKVAAQPGSTGNLFDPNKVTNSYEQLHQKRPRVMCRYKKSPPHQQMIDALQFNITKDLQTFQPMTFSPACSPGMVEFPV